MGDVNCDRQLCGLVLGVAGWAALQLRWKHLKAVQGLLEEVRAHASQTTRQ